jgi:hypothetical protein
VKAPNRDCEAGQDENEGGDDVEGTDAADKTQDAGHDAGDNSKEDEIPTDRAARLEKVA